MSDIDKLSNRLEDLQKNLHRLKKATMNSEDFLHSGEMAMIRFVAHYNQRLKKDPTLVIISNTVGISQATVTTVADRLIKKGLISKISSPDDKRAKLISLTAKGQECYNSNRQRQLELLTELTDTLGEKDSQELIRLIDKINNHFNKKGLRIE